MYRAPVLFTAQKYRAPALFNTPKYQPPKISELIRPREVVPQYNDPFDLGFQDGSSIPSVDSHDVTNKDREAVYRRRFGREVDRSPILPLGFSNSTI